jgi:hypothetical protein
VFISSRWPGYLDNTIAGGIPNGSGVFESLLKESMEEASLEESVIRKHAKAVGVISYFLRCAVTSYPVSLLRSGGVPGQKRDGASPGSSERLSSSVLACVSYRRVGIGTSTTYTSHRLPTRQPSRPSPSTAR